MWKCTDKKLDSKSKDLEFHLPSKKHLYIFVNHPAYNKNDFNKIKDWALDHDRG